MHQYIFNKLKFLVCGALLYFLKIQSNNYNIFSSDKPHSNKCFWVIFRWCYLGQDTHCPHQYFSCFSSVPPGNITIVPKIRLWLLSAISFQIYCSVIVPFNIIWPEIPTMSLNKPLKINNYEVQEVWYINTWYVSSGYHRPSETSHIH